MDIGDALLVQSPDALPDLVGIRHGMTLVNISQRFAVHLEIELHPRIHSQLRVLEKAGNGRMDFCIRGQFEDG